MQPQHPDAASPDADTADLARLGYSQQLRRALSGFSNFALSFSIISILTGAVTLYGYGLKMAGPLVMSVGWTAVALLTLPIAASLAQLASSFPTAGALYHWAALLGGPAWGFFTAWLNTIGQFAITAGIDYGLAEFVAAGVGWPADRPHVLPLYALLLASHAALNHVGVRAVALLNWLSAWYHLVGVALLVAALVVFAPKQPAAFLYSRFSVEHKPYWLAFALGLLQATWTFTGYDASAHVGEETVDPRRNAPRGILLSVGVSAVAGLAMLVAVTLAAGDLAAAARADNPFLFILAHALGPRLGAALGWMVMGAMWFCGLASVTSNSRMLFAFARDGGLPASRHLAAVSATYATPHAAVWVSAAAAFVVALWSRAYAAMVALSTVALYVSYGLPIAVGLAARASGRWRERGPFDLGRASPALNAIALAWIAVVTVLMALPPNEIAGYTFAGCLALLAIYWLAWMRGRFRGPPLAGRVQ